MSFKRSRSKIIKYPAKLSFDYVPNELPHRDEQHQQLFTLFSRVIPSGISQNAFLYGPVGTGKTATAKRFSIDFSRWAQEEEGKVVNHVIVNCRRRSNNSQTMYKILKHFDSNFPDRGFSVGEMVEILQKHIEKKKVHLLVVLDEVDTLIQRDGSDIIYLLSRMKDEQEYQSPHSDGQISLILISQKNALELLDKSSLSTFKRSNRIRFPRYTPDQMYDILKIRSELALFDDTIDDDEIRQLSFMTGHGEEGEGDGDARFGIELLERSALIAEGKGKRKIEPEDVRAAQGEVKPFSASLSLLRELKSQEKIILLAASKELKSRAFTTTGDLKDVYEIVCEEQGEKPLQHTQFWKYIKNLSAKGLLSTQTSSTGKGRTTQISITDVPVEELEIELRKILER